MTMAPKVFALVWQLDATQNIVEDMKKALLMANEAYARLARTDQVAGG
jgi:hypothetical protein